VSCAVVDAGGGTLAAVSIFETAGGLKEADRLLAAWAAEHLAGSSRSAGETTTGEVIVQRGL
jgi:hypothetical protein